EAAVARPDGAHLRAPDRSARLGGAAVGRPRHLAAPRGDREVLGHLPPHRQRPRRRTARQPGSLPDPDRPLRLTARRGALDRAGPYQAQRRRGRSRLRLVGARRRPADRGGGGLCAGGGPPSLMLVGGASLATLGVMALTTEALAGRRDDGQGREAPIALRMRRVFLVG